MAETTENKAVNKTKSSSAEKQVSVSAKRRQRNKGVRSSVKTTLGKAEKLIAAGNTEEAKASLAVAASVLDKAAGKKVIHRNSAARRKSRLAKKLNAAAVSPAVEEKPKEAE